MLSALRPAALAALLGLTGASPGLADRPRDLGEAVERALVSDGLRGAIVGVAVREVASGRLLYANGAGRPLLPASNQKVATAAAALLALGPDWTWETTLLRQGDVESDGTLAGALLVRGSGDPTISARFGGGRAAATLERWAEAVRAAGVRRVSGEILCDDSAFDAVRVHPSWPEDQLTNWYCAEISALTLNDACVDATVEPAALGAPPVVRLDPETAFVSLRNEATTTRKGNEFGFQRKPGTNEIRLTGRVSAGTGMEPASVTIADPALFFGTVLRECLGRAGVKVEGPARRATAAEAARPGVPLAVHRTPLRVALPVCLQRSQNLYAEHLLKTLGRATRREGSFAAGAAAVVEALTGAGLEDGSLRPADGSGLSRENRASADALARILAHAARSPHGDLFRDCLAAPGEEGTLKKRLLEEPARGRVRAKTGYLNGVSALSGYADSPGGRRLAFSVVVNGFRGASAPAKSLEDAVARACADLAAPR
ncbi:MAG: D-alanyl-D-alanine carboxypeptidase/D-alanyl-D-alanine-endopeptidase [Planctomycetales bacterium]|nr:D-alanyl-D-alanine carboxypeptidase/D-alanyl-D-alanine-endopeptidase [Planctomycetales bacterium]